MDPSDSLDTPILTAGARGWSGVTNRQKAAAIGADQLAVLVNGRLDDTGSVQLRPGTEWLAKPVAAPVRGLGYFDVAGAEAALAFAYGKAYELPADRQPLAPIEIPNLALSTNGPYEAVESVDKLIVADGIRLLGLWRQNGAWQSMQVSTFTDGTLLPAVRHVLAHAFRVFICGGSGVAGEIVYGSDVLDPFSISNTVGVRVGRGEGDAIVALRPGPGQKFFALKSGSVWWVDTTGTADQWQCDAVTHEVGCWAGATAVVVNQDVLFLSRRGVAQLSRLQNDAPVSPADFVSAPIEATMARINWSAARRTACASLWREYYLLAVPLDGAQQNNTVLAYNTRTGQWSGEWTGWAPTAWCRSQFDGQTETLMGTAAGDIVRLDDLLTTDGGDGTAAPIPLELETRAEAFDAADLLKMPHALDCEWRGGQAAVDVSLRADGGSPQVIEEDYETAPEDGGANRRLIANLRSLAGGRELQIRMVTTGGAFGLRELFLKALPLRARWTPPPAELLVPPVPADDAAGTDVTLRDADGNTTTARLQEIDTITLPHDSLDFVCFRGGLTVPAGSYVIAYRRGSFSETWEGSHDLESETIGAAYEFPGGSGWTGPLRTFWWPDGQGSDDSESYASGTLSTFTAGDGWTTESGRAVAIEYTQGADDSENYAAGTLSTFTAGNGWTTEAGRVVTIEYTQGADDSESYAAGTLSTFTAGDGWAANGNSFIPA
ncbi:MAG TPA: hypothetical protein VK178_07250 [Opitutaceae bacterium]|nr:hypothetical protein [Opitutaceae bacterium]